MRSIRASKFKAKCLEILDEVSRTGETVTILKHGRPLVQIGPVSQVPRYPQDTLRGKKVETLGDIVTPAVPAEDWDAERGEFEPTPP